MTLNVSDVTGSTGGSCFRLVPHEEETELPYALHVAPCAQEALAADYGTAAVPKIRGLCQYTDCMTKEDGHCKMPFR